MDDKLTHIPELKDGGAADSALPTNERPSWLFNIPRSYVLIFFLVYLTIGVSVSWPCIWLKELGAEVSRHRGTEG